MFNFFKKKNAMEMEIIGWWVISIGVLVIIIVGIMILKSKGINALEFIKNLFRFRG